MANIQALRPYQQAARDSIHAQWEQGRLRTLLVLPTGTGKTIVFASVAADQVRAGDRVLILAHRGELLEQAADKLQRSTGLVSAVEKAESTCLNSWFRVVVGSVQTLQRPARLERFPRDYFGTIIIDEAHHAITDGYRRILDYFESAKVLGVTATPDRGDMRNLGEVFDSLAYEYKLTDAIKEGYLCKIMAQTIPLQLDISGVALSGGDYAVGELGTALDPYLEQIAAEMVQRCRGRKTVVFLPLIKTSQKFRDLLNAKGFQAAEVNGQSADRKEVLADFDAGKYNVLCNSMLLTEGWDCPSVDCVVVLRPTKVRSLYSQMVGRGTRLAEGKTDLLLLFVDDRQARALPPGRPCVRGQGRGPADDRKSGRDRCARGHRESRRPGLRGRGGPAGRSPCKTAGRTAPQKGKAGGPAPIRNEHSGRGPVRLCAGFWLGSRAAHRTADHRPRKAGYSAGCGGIGRQGQPFAGPAAQAPGRRPHHTKTDPLSGKIRLPACGHMEF